MEFKRIPESTANTLGAIPQLELEENAKPV